MRFALTAVKDGIRVYIVDRSAIQNSQWLNYTLQFIPKQVLNMTEFKWKCEKRKIFFQILQTVSNQWIFMPAT